MTAAKPEEIEDERRSRRYRDRQHAQATRVPAASRRRSESAAQDDGDRPPAIARGQTLGSARRTDHHRFERGLAQLGDAFRIRVAPSVTAPRTVDSGVTAADDDTRVAELEDMLRASRRPRDSARARWATGSCGSAAAFLRAACQRFRKPIIGFSDATALLSWAHAGVRGVHGLMVSIFSPRRARDCVPD